MYWMHDCNGSGEWCGGKVAVLVSGVLICVLICMRSVCDLCGAFVRFLHFYIPLLMWLSILWSSLCKLSAEDATKLCRARMQAQLCRPWAGLDHSVCAPLVWIGCCVPRRSWRKKALAWVMVSLSACTLVAWMWRCVLSGPIKCYCNCSFE